MNPFEEVKGILKMIRHEGFFLVVVTTIDRKYDIDLIVTKDVERKSIKVKLRTNLIGKKIGILKTNNNRHPILVKKFSELEAKNCA